MKHKVKYTKNNVASIIKAKTCMKCGSCVSECPKNALKSNYNSATGFHDINFSSNKCVNCGKCRLVCPAVGYLDLSKTDGYNKLIGKRINIVLAHSSNRNIRHNSTSGGVVNSLVRFLIVKDIVDAILLCSFDMQPENMTSTLIVTKDNICDMTDNPRNYSSRYVLMPLCERAKDMKKYDRIAIVGTGCQIYGATRIFKDYQRDNIVFIGITCSGGESFLATKRLFDIEGVKNVTKVYYRGKGWPGKNTIVGDPTVENSHMHSIFNTIYSSQMYLNSGCKNCKDDFAELADISVFDFWNNQEMLIEKDGKTGVIIRTARGEEIFNKAINGGYINQDTSIDEKSVVMSQLNPLMAKKYNLYFKPPICFFQLLVRIMSAHVFERFIGRKTFMLLSRVNQKLISIYAERELYNLENEIKWPFQ